MFKQINIIIKIGDNMKKLNNKGFTLVEIIAVMAILVILLGIAIGSYTAIILDSQKSAFVAEAMVQVKGIRNFIETEDIYVEDDNTVYYFNYRLGVESSESPFEQWEDCYVVVTYNPESEKNSFYWTGLDKDKWGIKLHKEAALLTKEDVVHKSMTSLTPGSSIGGRDNVVIYDVAEDGDPDDYTEESRMASNEMTYEEAEPCFTLNRLDDGTYEITDYKKSCGPVVDVPSSVDGKTVTYIGENAFRNKGITSITIYHGIKELKYGAFQQNPDLKEIKIASTVKKIGDYAFYNGKLEKVIFPEGLEEIGEYSFAYNKISSVYFSSTLKKIGYRAFLGNNLQDVEFNSAVSIGGGAFSNNQLSPEAGFIYGYTNGVADYSKLIGYGGENKDVIIPPTKNGVALKTIASSAFSDANINSVVIPDTVTEIGSSAFYNNNLKSIVFPSGLIKIGSSAFRDNYLSEINIPSSVTSIGNGAFTDNCVTLNSAKSFIYKVGDKSTIVSGASGQSSGCSTTTTGKLIIPAKKDGYALKRIVGSAFIGGKFTGIEFPSLSQTPNLTLDANFIVHNSPGNAITEENGYVYAITNGKYDYSTIIAYMGKRAPNSNGVYTFPAKKNNVELKTITASLTWAGAKKIIIPATVTSLPNSAIFSKTNNANPDLVTIVNKTGREFDWYKLTGSQKTNPGKFVTGVVQHQSGNIEIVAS